LYPTGHLLDLDDISVNTCSIKVHETVNIVKQNDVIPNITITIDQARAVEPELKFQIFGSRHLKSLAPAPTPIFKYFGSSSGISWSIKTSKPLYYLHNPLAPNYGGGTRNQISGSGSTN